MEIEKYKESFRNDSALIQGFRDALPPTIEVKRFLSTALIHMASAPKLKNCTKLSVLQSLVKCAQDGLVPDGREAAIVPMKGTAAYFPMVAGIKKQILNSEKVLDINTGVVYRNDKFNYRVTGNGPNLLHDPDIFSKDRGEIIAAYAVANLLGGGSMVEVLNAKDIDNIRRSSKSNDFWDRWTEEMWKKSAARRLAKSLPKSPQSAGHYLKHDVSEIVKSEIPAIETKKEPSGLLDAVNVTPGWEDEVEKGVFNERKNQTN